MSATVKQIGQVSAQLKSQIEQFQANLDQNDVLINQLKEHFVESNVTLDALSNSISRRDSDSVKIRDSLDFAEICVNNIQTATAALDNDAMQSSRMWEALVTASSQTADPYYNRSFSSGRVAFSVPSTYFDSLAGRSLTESATVDTVVEELAKIEEFFVNQLKEGQRPSDIDEKVRAALVHKIHELKSTSNKQ